MRKKLNIKGVESFNHENKQCIFPISHAELSILAVSFNQFHFSREITHFIV